LYKFTSQIEIDQSLGMHEFGITMDDCEVMHTKLKNSKHSKYLALLIENYISIGSPQKFYHLLYGFLSIALGEEQTYHESLFLSNKHQSHCTTTKVGCNLLV
jgi:hypothetical protein